MPPALAALVFADWISTSPTIDRSRDAPAAEIGPTLSFLHVIVMIASGSRMAGSESWSVWFGFSSAEADA